MKPRLTATVLLLSSFTFNPDLLKQLQVLLTRLSEVLAAQVQLQPRTTIIYRSAPSPSAMSRVTLDIATSSARPEAPGQKPKISGVTPGRGGLGTIITIRGSGFTKTGNVVFASYGTLPDLPSPDSETITLRVEPPGLPPNLGALKTATFPELRYRFYIQNVNGATLVPGEFVLDL